MLFTHITNILRQQFVNERTQGIVGFLGMKVADVLEIPAFLKKNQRFAS